MTKRRSYHSGNSKNLRSSVPGTWGNDKIYILFYHTHLPGFLNTRSPKLSIQSLISVILFFPPLPSFFILNLSLCPLGCEIPHISSLCPIFLTSSPKVCHLALIETCLFSETLISPVPFPTSWSSSLHNSYYWTQQWGRCLQYLQPHPDPLCFFRKVPKL